MLSLSLLQVLDVILRLHRMGALPVDLLESNDVTLEESRRIMRPLVARPERSNSTSGFGNFFSFFSSSRAAESEEHRVSHERSLGRLVAFVDDCSLRSWIESTQFFFSLFS